MDLEVPASSQKFHNSPGFWVCTSQHPLAGGEQGLCDSVKSQANSDSDEGSG